MSLVQKFFVRGVMPSLNSLTRAGHVAAVRGETKHYSPYGQAKKRWTLTVRKRAVGARLRPVESGHFTFLHLRPDMTVDPDNFCSPTQKIVLDALQPKVLRNDGWKQVLSLTHFWATVRAPDAGFWVFIGDRLTEDDALAMAGVERKT